MDNMNNMNNLSIRKLVEADFDDVIQWRSDPTTMKMSKFTGEITESGFRPVFNRYLTNPSYIITHNNGDNMEKIAIINLVVTHIHYHYEIGINMNPAFRGMGLAKPCLLLFLSHLKKTCNDDQDTYDISTITAHIKQENVASIKLFTGAGFQQITSLEPGYHQYLYLL